MRPQFLAMALLQTSLLLSPTYQQTLTVQILDQNNFCLVVPKYPNTPIGDSEYEGGMTVWCTGYLTPGATGTFNGRFWSDVELSRPKPGVIQMTGCINVSSSDRLDAKDPGGQYDSNGGAGGRGNPAGSVCRPYPIYVQLIEPASKRACIRCCQDAADCVLSMDTQGCPQVVPGNYFTCA